MTVCECVKEDVADVDRGDRQNKGVEGKGGPKQESSSHVANNALTDTHILSHRLCDVTHMPSLTHTHTHTHTHTLSHTHTHTHTPYPPQRSHRTYTVQTQLLCGRDLVA